MIRNIWGAEGFEEISIRHSKFAAGRFAQEASPALERFASSSPGSFLDGIKASRAAIVARDADERQNFLRKRGFSKGETEKIIATVLQEEGHPPSRSEEHTSELQSLMRISYAVFCLKKKKHITYIYNLIAPSLFINHLFIIH